MSFGNRCDSIGRRVLLGGRAAFEWQRAREGVRTLARLAGGWGYQKVARTLRRARKELSRAS